MPLLAALALGDAAYCVFDYSFGADCPPCKAFGKTLKQIYAADGIAEALGSSRMQFALLATPRQTRPTAVPTSPLAAPRAPAGWSAPSTTPRV